MSDYKLGKKVGSDQPFMLSETARLQAAGQCVPHVHRGSPHNGTVFEVRCDRHHWERILISVRWGARSAWECAECGAGAHVEDPANERAEREACRA